MAGQSLGDLNVTLGAKTSEFRASIEKAVKSIKSVKSAAEKVRKTAGIAFAGLAGVIALATKAAETQRRAVQSLEIAISNSQEAIDSSKVMALAGALQEVTTYGDEATAAIAGMLVPFGLNENQLLTILPLIQDMAAFTGIDLPMAAKQFGMAMGGSAESLKQYGIVLSETEKKAYRTATTTERFALISEKMSKTFGGSAQAMAKTAGGAFRQFTNLVGDLQEQFGEMLQVPLGAFFNSLSGYVSKVINFFSGLSDETKYFIGVATLVTAGIAGLVTVGAGLLATFAGLAAAIPPILAGLSAIGVIGGTAGGAISVGFLPVTAIVLGVVASVGLAILAVGALRRAWEENWGGVQDIVSDVAKNIVRMWEWATGLIHDMLDPMIKGVRQLLELVGSVAKIAIPGIAGALTAGVATAPAPKIAAPGVGPDINVIDEVIKTFSSGVKTLLPGLAGLLDGAKSAASELIGVSDAGGMVSTEMEAAKRAAGEFSEGLKSAAKTAKEKASEMVGPPLPPDFFDKPKMEMAESAASFSSKTTDLFHVMADNIGMGGDMVAGALQTFAGMLSRGGEQLSAAVQGFVQGFQTGGIIGAVIGAILGLLSTLDEFQQMLEVANRGFGPIMDALGWIFGAFTELFDAIGAFSEGLSDLANITMLLQPAMDLLGATLAPLVELFGAMAKEIEKVVGFIDEAWSAAMFEIGKIFREMGLEDIANSLQERYLSKRLSDALDDSIRAQTEEAKRLMERTRLLAAAGRAGTGIDYAADREDLPGVVKSTADAMGDLADTVQEVNEQLTNVPDAFKVALARYQAIDVGEAPAGGVGNIFNISVSDISELDRKLQERGAYANMVQTGTTATGGQFSVARAGS